MINTCLIRLAATAGTQLVKTFEQYCHYQYAYRILSHILRHWTKTSSIEDRALDVLFFHPSDPCCGPPAGLSQQSPFLQVTSSAVRPLTKIPHCCTYIILGFFRPQCGRSTVSASTQRIFGLLSHYLNNYLSPRFFISS